MAERRAPSAPNNFQTAIDDLTDGLSHLVRQHFELARCEVRNEVNQVKNRAIILAACAVFGLIGYVILNIALILIAAAIFGTIAAGAITATVLAVLQLGGAGIGFFVVKKRFEEDDMGLPETTEEMQRNKKWLKEIRSNSSSPKALPAESS